MVRAGYSANAEIVLEQKDSVLSIKESLLQFDKKTEKLIEEIDVSHLDVSTFKKIFNPPIEDSLMYYPYDIDSTIGSKIIKIIKINFDFDKYHYQLDCFQK